MKTEAMKQTSWDEMYEAVKSITIAVILADKKKYRREYQWLLRQRREVGKKKT